MYQEGLKFESHICRLSKQFWGTRIQVWKQLTESVSECVHAWPEGGILNSPLVRLWTLGRDSKGSCVTVQAPSVGKRGFPCTSLAFLICTMGLGVGAAVTWIPPAGWHLQQKRISSRSWRLPLCHQGAIRVRFWWGLSFWLVDDHLLSKSSCGLSFCAWVLRAVDSPPLLRRTPVSSNSGLT